MAGKAGEILSHGPFETSLERRICPERKPKRLLMIQERRRDSSNDQKYISLEEEGEWPTFSHK